MSLVTIANFSEPLDANVAKSKLESEGIKAFLQDENTQALMGPLYGNMIGGIRLQVVEAQLEEVIKILGIGD